MLKRWQVLGKSAAVKTAIAFTLVLSLVTLPLPASMGWAQGEAEAAPPAQTPGQKTRRGLAGSVISVTSAATTTAASIEPVIVNDPVLDGDPIIEGDPPTEGDPLAVGDPIVQADPTVNTILTISSNFGDVQVLISDETRIHSPFYEDLSAEDLYGYRLAIHFAKGPENDDGTRTALKIMVIPGKAARTHSRGVIRAKNGGDDGEFEVEGDDGEVIELGDDADDGDLEVGDDVILVTQTVGDFEGDGDSPRKPKKIARGLLKSSKIMERLNRIADKLTDRITELGESPATEKLKARVEKFKAKHLKRFTDLNTRFFGSGSDSDSDDGKLNRGGNNNQRGKGRPVDVGSTDIGPSDDGGDDGKLNRGRNRGRSIDLSPRGNDTDDDDGGNQNRGKRKARNSGNRGGNR